MIFSIYQLLFFFIIYAITGWCVEVAFAAFESKKFVNRGFLNGPYCPIYGFGAVTVIVCLIRIKKNIGIFFIASILLTSLLEFITGFILEHIFNEKWWDYSKERFNIKGYICLEFSVIWGLACIIVVYLIHPLIIKLVNWIPHTIGTIILIIIGILFIVDILMTVLTILNIKKSIKLLNAISVEIKNVSDFAGEKIYDKVVKFVEKGDEYKVKNPEQSEKIENLIIKYNKSMDNLNVKTKRLWKAFANLKRTSTFKEYIKEIKNKK